MTAAPDAPDESTRAQVLELVRRFPGIHMRGIVREMEISTALATYHLKALTAEGRLRAVRAAGYVRYFPREGFRELSAQDRQALGLLRQTRPLEIVLALLEHGPLTHGELVEIVGGAKPTLTYHLHKLIDGGIVAKVPRGEERGFHLVDPERLRGLLAQYEPTSTLLDEVHDTWEDLFGGHRRG